ncbi:MAG: M56 family metallopeptidase [Pirellulaceae bacterium]
MSENLLNELPAFLLRTSLAIAIAAIVIWSLLKILQLKSPALHRFAWLVVLIQGCVVARFAWDIPWYEPIAPQSTESVADPSMAMDKLGEVTPLTLADSPENAQSTTGDANKVPSTPPAAGTPSVMSSSTGENGSAISDSAVSPPWWNAIPDKFLSIGTLVYLWIGGITVLVLLQLTAYLSVLKSLGRTSSASPHWEDQWNLILRRAGIRKSIPLRVHDSLGPLICLVPAGYQIVVPRELWEELSERQRAAVLHHELAHYLRGDVWKSLMARVLALPHWFNPLAWLAVRKFEESGEWACDRYLMNHDPSVGTEFADALLRIVQFPQPRGFLSLSPSTVGISSAGGSSLRERVRRLCGSTRPEDSLVKRATSMLVLVIVFAVGLAEVRLVARAMAQEVDETAATQQEDDSAIDDLSPEDRMRLFAERISTGDNDLFKKFKEVLNTPAGQTALRERASGIEFEARQAAQQDAMPEFLQQHFEQSDDGLVLRPDQDEFRERVMRQTAEYQGDVDQIQVALNTIADKLSGDHEADKMLRRVLEHQLTAWVLYVTEIRQRIRPDERTILELYESVFVVAPSGKFVVRPGVRARIEEQLARGGARRQALKQITDELKIISDEIVPADKLHEQVKELFQDEYFAAFCCYDSIGNSNEFDDRIENLFNYIDNLFEDHSDGRRLAEESSPEVQQLVQRVLGRREAARRLREPVKEFSQRIDAERDDLHQRVQQAFDSTLVLAMLTQEGDMRTTNGSRVVREMLDDSLVESPDGSMAVGEESRDEVIEYARGLLRYQRQFRRRLARVDQRVATIVDEELRHRMLTKAGTYLMLRSINQQLASRQFDGLGMWIDRHFTETDNGFVPLDDARVELEEFLEQVASIQAELDKDDF